MAAASETLTAFVRGTLGCGCPDQVFEQVEISDRTDPFQTLNVGGRLLILLVRTNDGATVTDGLQRWVDAGRRQRDREGFNRLRLVIATSDPGEVKRVAEAAFQASAGRDDRIHLHVIRVDEAPPLSGA